MRLQRNEYGTTLSNGEFAIRFGSGGGVNGVTLDGALAPSLVRITKRWFRVECPILWQGAADLLVIRPIGSYRRLTVKTPGLDTDWWLFFRQDTGELAFAFPCDDSSRLVHVTPLFQRVGDATASYFTGRTRIQHRAIPMKFWIESRFRPGVDIHPRRLERRRIASSQPAASRMSNDPNRSEI